MSLRFSYTLLAPIYDWIVAAPTEPMRRHSLQRITTGSRQVLIAGVGSGLDLPHLPAGKNYCGMDITPAMLKKAYPLCRQRNDTQLVCADVQQLPCRDNCFDSVVLHLILAVVPHPEKLLGEVARTLRPGGQVLIIDKFLRPGRKAPIRRMLNLLTRHIATRTDVVFESVLAGQPELELVHDRPAGLGGWFREIELRKK